LGVTSKTVERMIAKGKTSPTVGEVEDFFEEGE
jgi:hypothetical protein